MPRKRITPTEWLTRQPEMVSWASNYISKRVHLYYIPPFPPLLDKTHPDNVRNTILDALNNERTGELFRTAKNAWAQQQHKKRHESLTINIKLDRTSYDNLKALSGRKTMRSTIQSLISNATRVEEYLENKYKNKILSLQKKPKDKIFRVNEIEREALIKTAMGLISPFLAASTESMASTTKSDVSSDATEQKENKLNELTSFIEGRLRTKFIIISKSRLQQSRPIKGDVIAEILPTTPQASGAATESAMTSDDTHKAMPIDNDSQD